MPDYFLVLAVLVLMGFGYQFGRSRAVAQVGGRISELHSLPSYYGGYVAIWCGAPALLLVFIWLAAEPVVVREVTLAALPPSVIEQADDPELAASLAYTAIQNHAAGVLTATELPADLASGVAGYRAATDFSRLLQTLAVLVVALSGGAYAFRRLVPPFPARLGVERFYRLLLLLASTAATLVAVGIVLSLLFEAIRFFLLVSPWEFLSGLHWSPQTAIRADQVGSSGAFGAVPVFTGTLMITIIAVGVAGPIGLVSAIYLAEYAPPHLRSLAKPVLEILAGIPTVVYGFFAAITVAPFFGGLGDAIGLDVSANTALAAGSVMGIMLIPFISSLSDDVINAVPQTLRDGSYAVGATQSETIVKVILPAALPGIIGSFLLAISRAIGETMIVVMAAGLAARLTANPLESVTTVTVQIVALLTGDQEFDSAKTLSAFALGLVLFVLTLGLNLVALTVVNRYREKYD